MELMDKVPGTLMLLPRLATILWLSLASSICLAEAPRVVLSTTQGDMIIELADDRAPVTVENFLKYVEEGFYDGTIFHRVIEGFMIQGGGFDEKYKRKSTRSAIANEASNGLRNQRYTISMARTNSPHSATSQFFINAEDNINLDHQGPTPRGWGYAVFGRVIDGQDIVDKISQVSTGPGGPFSRDAPREKIIINEIAIIGGVESIEEDVAEPADSTEAVIIE